MKYVQDLPVNDKKVLVRVDFNVPLNHGAIADDTRIRESLPTIHTLLKKGGAVILMSHLGRPEGKVDPQYSLKPCSERLSTLLNQPVLFASDCIGPDAKKKVAALQGGQVLVLENLRFHSAEEKPEKDPTFAKSLASLGDFYVNDAFGTAHRAHSSTALIAKYFPGKAAAGLLLQKEIESLNKALENPTRPFFALIGGAKVSTKLGVLRSLLNKVDALFIGGGMTYTFLKAQGLSIGDSLSEESLLAEALSFLTLAKEKKIPLFFPVDIVVADRFANDATHKAVLASNGIPAGWQGMDIGPKTCEMWKKELSKGKTFFWNGPFGVFEFPQFAKGTQFVAEFLSSLNATTIVGGGDSVAAVNGLGLSKKFSHLSTGGGASLEYVEWGHLPGIDALEV